MIAVFIKLPWLIQLAFLHNYNYIMVLIHYRWARHYVQPQWKCVCVFSHKYQILLAFSLEKKGCIASVIIINYVNEYKHTHSHSFNAEKENRLKYIFILSNFPLVIDWQDVQNKSRSITYKMKILLCEYRIFYTINLGDQKRRRAKEGY